MSKVLIIVLALLALLAACAAHIKGKTGSHFDRASVDDFDRLLAREGVQLLDVRTQQEFDEGHLEGATLVDVHQDAFMERAARVLDINRPVAVYCRSGRRSAQAAGILAVNGYRVTNLEGGILAWQQAGKPVVKP